MEDVVTRARGGALRRRRLKKFLRRFFLFFADAPLKAGPPPRHIRRKFRATQPKDIISDPAAVTIFADEIPKTDRHDILRNKKHSRIDKRENQVIILPMFGTL